MISLGAWHENETFPIHFYLNSSNLFLSFVFVSYEFQFDGLNVDCVGHPLVSGLWSRESLLLGGRFWCISSYRYCSVWTIERVFYWTVNCGRVWYARMSSEWLQSAVANRQRNASVRSPNKLKVNCRRYSMRFHILYFSHICRLPLSSTYTRLHSVVPTTKTCQYWFKWNDTSRPFSSAVASMGFAFCWKNKIKENAFIILAVEHERSSMLMNETHTNLFHT